MTVFNCVLEKQARIVSADSPEEAASQCLDIYGFHPERVIELKPGQDEPQ